MTKLANKFLAFADEMQERRLPSHLLFHLFVERHNLNIVTANKLHFALVNTGVL